MAHFIHEGTSITGLSVAVPKKKIDNRKDNPFFNEKEVEGIIKATGIGERRITDKETCSSDLCFYSADSLLNKMAVNRKEIDLLIFVSQTPDYKMPGSGIILQNRLALEKHCTVLDVSLGCSGFVYGLNLVYSLSSQTRIRKALLLNGETKSKVYSMKDKQTGLLFGDAGSACLVEKTGDSSKSFFSLMSDGSKSHYIKIPSGGYRNPTTIESLKEKQYEDGSIRTDEHGVMDGAAVFDFTIREVPNNIKETMDFANNGVSDIDFFVLHQANKFINNHIAKKLGVPQEKLPYSLDRFGNTSSVSIPVTIVSEIAEQVREKPRKLLLSGFGVGLSWGTAIIETNCPFIDEIIEV